MRSERDIQAAHIADIAVAGANPPTKTEWDAMATKFNAILTALENQGVLAKS